ncbi:MAG: gamma carbonic anhydrase family protein [Gammaproteobacteria bacterium]|nr:gamma carbonic anhydrase family protein [Gammaproteobacteria bacterium]MDH5728845.1 gamma carbonic anhydrase family protein [Gammaproteobacteria bacterium]
MAIRDFQGHSPHIAAGVYIDEMALVIGKVSIGADSSVWPMSVLRGDVHSISVGERSNIQDGSILHVTSDNEFTPGGYSLTIGNDVTVGHGAILHACTIGNFCLIGMGATVLDGVVVEDEVMVGAGSLVTPGKVLNSGYLYVGSPARQARALNDKEKKYLHYSSRHYVNVKNQHMC